MTTPPAVDWNGLERTWLRAVLDTLASTASAHPRERWEAAAFWMLYADGATILSPVFGMNPEGTHPEIRWHPPDWRWSILETAHEAVAPFYEPLARLDVDEATFGGLWSRHVEVLVRVCRRATREVRSGALPVPETAFSSEFFVGILDLALGDATVDLLRRSVDAATLETTGLLEELA